VCELIIKPKKKSPKLMTLWILLDNFRICGCLLMLRLPLWLPSHNIYPVVLLI
jgi:hypothetical protein